VEAIRLAEIALAGEPENRAALETNLRAHETLEAASENFWLTSWLRRRIQSLRSALE
jgi:hypothetical protein